MSANSNTSDLRTFIGQIDEGFVQISGPLTDQA